MARLNGGAPGCAINPGAVMRVGRVISAKWRVHEPSHEAKCAKRAAEITYPIARPLPTERPERGRPE